MPENLPSNCFVAITGNIGAGKSTLTRMLSERLKWKPFYEANAENPYLADFYQDMQRWSFHSQMFFMSKRLEHHRLLVDYPGCVLQDRTVYEDAEIFARNLHNQGMMSERDWNTYRSLYRAISAFLPPPDLIIYLKADADTLLRHINARGRDYEQNIAPEYVVNLNQLYNLWIEDWTVCPVLTIDMNSTDFQHNNGDFDGIVTQVQQALQPQV